jgi:hypothetical protein
LFNGQFADLLLKNDRALAQQGYILTVCGGLTCNNRTDARLA